MRVYYICLKWDHTPLLSNTQDTYIQHHHLHYIEVQKCHNVSAPRPVHTHTETDIHRIHERAVETNGYGRQLDSRMGIQQNGYWSYYGYVVVENHVAYLRMTPACIYSKRIGLRRCKLAYFNGRSLFILQRTMFLGNEHWKRDSKPHEHSKYKNKKHHIYSMQVNKYKCKALPLQCICQVYIHSPGYSPPRQPNLQAHPGTSPAAQCPPLLV